jgi:hypothetical protein
MVGEFVGEVVDVGTAVALAVGGGAVALGGSASVGRSAFGGEGVCVDFTPGVGIIGSCRNVDALHARGVRRMGMAIRNRMVDLRRFTKSLDYSTVDQVVPGRARGSALSSFSSLPGRKALGR